MWALYNFSTISSYVHKVCLEWEAWLCLSLSNGVPMKPKEPQSRRRHCAATVCAIENPSGARWQTNIFIHTFFFPFFNSLISFWFFFLKYFTVPVKLMQAWQLSIIVKCDLKPHFWCLITNEKAISLKNQDLESMQLNDTFTALQHTYVKKTLEVYLPFLSLTTSWQKLTRR